jgi:magnesium-transporting ATPase (P-type)
MTLWFWDGYRMYSSCILIISTGSIVASLMEQITNNERVRKMAKYSCAVDLMQSDSSFKNVQSSELLPGDVIRIP